jgi:hypothetical protein
MGQESHTQDTVLATQENNLTPQQEEILWSEHYEKIFLKNILEYSENTFTFEK